MDTRGNHFEITRHISLRALTPLGLLTLRRTGSVEFALPQSLFDMDFPGFYHRRIKTVTLSIPCVAGPYNSISRTLRLLSHRYRYTTSQASCVKNYAAADGGDSRFCTNLVPISAIAVGTAQSDGGVFHLNFRDERYLPFEGAGAVSCWRLEMPADARLFDYDTIGDVVMHLRYTSASGGERLKTAASGALLSSLTKIGSSPAGGGGAVAPLAAVLDLKNDFPSEWHKFAAAGPAGTRNMTLSGLQSNLPFYAKSVAAKAPVSTQVTAVPGAAGPDITVLDLRLQDKPFDFKAEEVGFAKAFRPQGDSP